MPISAARRLSGRPASAVAADLEAANLKIFTMFTGRFLAKRQDVGGMRRSLPAMITGTDVRSGWPAGRLTPTGI